MNRFDESFNGIDRISGRPFSSGHPDGVWMIAIIYTLIFMGTLVGPIMTMMFSGMSQLKMELIIPIIATGVMFFPPIVLLFMRKKAAFIWLAVLALIYAAGAVTTGMKLQRDGQLTGAALFGVSLVVAAQAYIAYYAYRLKKDALLR